MPAIAFIYTYFKGPFLYQLITPSAALAIKPFICNTGQLKSCTGFSFPLARIKMRMKLVKRSKTASEYLLFTVVAKVIKHDFGSPL